MVHEERLEKAQFNCIHPYVISRTVFDSVVEKTEKSRYSSDDKI